MTIDNYPCGLIPQCGWNPCIGVTDLIGVVPQCVIARRLDGPIDKFVDNSLGEDNSFLKSETFRESGLVDMSLSLLGALLTVTDMRLRQTGDASFDWDGKEVDAANLVEKYVVEPEGEWFCVSWLVGNIHARQFPYKKNVEKGSYKELKKNVEKVTGIVLGEFEEYLSQETPLTSTTVLSHKPTMLNLQIARPLSRNSAKNGLTHCLLSLAKNYLDILFLTPPLTAFSLKYHAFSAKKASKALY